MAFRDLLRKLGIGSDSDEIQPGVRRARLPQRAADAPTIRVPAGQPVDPHGPSPHGQSGPPQPAPTATPRTPTAPPSGPAPPAAHEPPRPAPAPPPQPPPSAPGSSAPHASAPPASASHGGGGDLGGATQYIRVGEPEPMDLVAVLVGIQGPLKGQIYRVQDGETKLGREGCQVTLPSRRISRFHARIQHVDGAFVIEANPEVLGKNPTVLNDEEIDAEALSDGDTLRLGDCTFRFRTI